MFNMFADWLVEDVFGLSITSKFGGALHFFIYDTLKILFLLSVMVFAISFVRSYFPPEKVKRWISGKKKGIASVLAALLGVVSPFCSCSTVPLFIGFVEAGIPLGVTFTFLISSPIVNEVSLVMLFSIFGWKIAVLYVLFGVLLAIIAGWVIGKLKLEKYVEPYVFNIQLGESVVQEMTMRERFIYAKTNVIDTVKKIWLFLLIGIGIGAWIHGYVPEDLLVHYAGKESIFAIPVAVILGVPLYSNAVGSLPMIEALMGKGVAPGTALSFMMAMTALSFPEMVLLRKVMKPQLIGIFVLIATTGIIAIGYIFNAIL
ncbi:permease [Anoxybacillus flavithermus]|uniref:Permease n=1 Tax=Anoxybacillus flavithermus TaxID=33934 RepID=A0A2G5RRA0_9BACL|nr:MULTISPECIES: permease [Anoxybacillus]KFZ43226.1 membrane protein [Anoxybacillus sp. KU2-6(11)]PIC05202.1 permease [Anoxybacillus flavithermus]